MDGSEVTPPLNGSEIAPASLSACLFGPFTLTDPSRRDVAPASTKARALIALVLVAPDHSRTRSFLAATLWSDRARAQALGSLRQALSEIRTALGPYRHLLLITRKTVAFAKGAVQTDLADAADLAAKGHRFLDGVVPADPEFGRWLETAQSRFGLEARKPDAPVLHIRSFGDASPLHKNAVAQGIAGNIADWCASQIATASDDVDGFDRNAAGQYAEYLLTARLHGQTGSGVGAHMALENNLTRQPYWTMVGDLRADSADLLHDAATYHLINSVTDRSLFSIAAPDSDSATARYLCAGVLGAVRRVFRNAPGDLDVALAQLERNFDIDGAGIHLAWSAYITTLQKGESGSVDQAELTERAERLAARAVELDPYGAMTLALCSYVNSFVLGRTDIGYDLANRSIALNRANPLAWIFRGAAHFFRGEGEAARRDTQYAQAIAGNGPYRYVVDTFCCVASTVYGNLDEALIYGEKAAAQAPGYRAPLRYLAAIHASRGNREALFDVLARLRKIEPGFSLEMVEEISYPVSALHASGLTRTR